MDLPDNVIDGLKCSQCQDFLSVFPIYSYSNGEFVCGRCPLIDDQSPTRDHSYEAVASYIKFPCKYKPYGCNELLVPIKMKAHEGECYYKQWFCPAISTACDWQGLLESLPEHYTSDHPDLIKKNNRFEVNDGVGDWEMNYLFNDDYLIKLKKIDSEGIFGAVSLIGLNYSTHIYNYKISWFLAGSNKSEASINGSANNYNGNPRICGNEGKLLKANAALPNVFEIEVVINRDDANEVQEKLGDLELNILRMIECPVCFDYMSAPIYQCENSHPVCSDCKQKTNVCGLCKIIIGNLRNRQLEDLSEKVRYKCQYDGCHAIYNLSQKAAHETQCEFMPYECPFDNCHFKNNFKLIHDHLIKLHAEDFCETNTINVYFEENYNSFKILKRGYCLFVVKSKVERNTLCVNVKFFGPKELNDDFNFIFDMRNNETHERVYFKRRCSDNDNDVNDMMVSVDMLEKFKTGICATFHIFIEDKKFTHLSLL